MTPIQSFATHSAQALPTPPSATTRGAADASSFKDFLMKSINDVNSAQKQADQAVETLMTGGDADPAAVLTAVQKADLSFRMMLQLRNKVMQAYQEIRDIRI